MVDIVDNKSHPESPAVAQRIGAARYIQFLWQDKFQASHGHVPAGGMVVGRNDDGFYSALILFILVVQFGDNHAQRHPTVGAHIFDRYIHLQNPAQGFHVQIPRIEFNGVLTTAYGHFQRTGAILGEHIAAAIHFDLRRIEVHLVPLFIPVLEVLVDRQGARPVQDHDDIGGIFWISGSAGQGQTNLEYSAAINAVCADFFG